MSAFVAAHRPLFLDPPSPPCSTPNLFTSPHPIARDPSSAHRQRAPQRQVPAPTRSPPAPSGCFKGVALATMRKFPVEEKSCNQGLLRWRMTWGGPVEKVAMATEYLSQTSSWVSVWGDYSQQVRLGPLARQFCQHQAAADGEGGGPACFCAVC